MLPNWLYGKSRSKLQEILGGGGGGGTSYTAGDGIDISSGVISFDPETTPAIDPSKIDGLDDDLAALAPKTAISNPNILHNPWFTVNQRGITSVTESHKYIADRWRTYTTLATFEVSRDSNGCIVIDNTFGSEGIALYQKRTTTYLNSLVGRKLTASVLLSDGTIYSGTAVFDGTNRTNYYENDSLILYAPAISNYQILCVAVKPGASVTIKALKLEVGEISTLHLDSRPEYALELAKCQRYFQRIQSTVSGQAVNLTIGSAVTSSQVILPLPITPMRATPTLTHSSVTIKSPQTGGSITPTAIGINTAGTNCIMLYCNSSVGNITAGSPWYLQIAPSGHIDFNAEI